MTLSNKDSHNPAREASALTGHWGHCLLTQPGQEPCHLQKGVHTFRYFHMRVSNFLRGEKIQLKSGLRRFLMHVPPKRFVRIRHYGLLSSRNKNRKITLCRNLLGCKKYLSRLKDLDAPAIIRLLYNKDVCKCSSCGGRIIPIVADPSLFQPEPHL